MLYALFLSMDTNAEAEENKDYKETAKCMLIITISIVIAIYIGMLTINNKQDQYELIFPAKDLISDIKNSVEEFTSSMYPGAAIDISEPQSIKNANKLYNFLSFWSSLKNHNRKIPLALLLVVLLVLIMLVLLIIANKVRDRFQQPT